MDDGPNTQYTDPDYEPENLNPVALEGLVSGYGVTYFNETVTLLNVVEEMLGVVNVNLVYESIDAAQVAFQARAFHWHLDEAEVKQVSAEKFGDDSIAYIMIGPPESEDDIEVVAMAISFQRANVIANMWIGGARPTVSMEKATEFARLIEQRLEQQIVDIVASTE
jgi:hypothetical protein